MIFHHSSVRMWICSYAPFVNKSRAAANPSCITVHPSSAVTSSLLLDARSSSRPSLHQCNFARTFATPSTRARPLAVSRGTLACLGTRVPSIMIAKTVMSPPVTGVRGIGKQLKPPEAEQSTKGAVSNSKQQIISWTIASPSPQHQHKTLSSFARRHSQQSVAIECSESSKALCATGEWLRLSSTSRATPTSTRDLLSLTSGVALMKPFKIQR